MFGSGSTPTQTTQTGFVGPQPQQQSETSLFPPHTNNLFGSNAFGKQTTGTVIKFSPVIGTDTIVESGVTQSVNTKHHCITLMNKYLTKVNKSLEELRFEDYCCNRKGPQQMSIFQGFGQSQGFGETPIFGQSRVVFGVPNQTSTSSLFAKPTAFGTTTSNASTFDFNSPSTSKPFTFSANQAQNPFCQRPFATTTTQPQPAFGTGVFGQTNSTNTQTTTGFSTEHAHFPFNQTVTNQASNLSQVSRPSGFGVDPFGTSTSTEGVTNQTNTSNLFSKPPIFETESLKKELKNRTIVTDKLSNKLNIMSEFEREVSEAVDKFKKAYKQENEMQELLIKIEEVKSELKEELHTMLTDKWNVERSKFDTQIEKLNKKILTLETVIESKDKLIERLVDCFKEERESISKTNLKIGELQNWKINKLKDELSRNNSKLGNDADTGTNVVAEIEQFEEKFGPILELESNLNEEKQKYQDLTVKYEILEDEHTVTKAKLIMEKETIENQFSDTKSEVQKLEAELKALKKAYNEQHELDQIRLESCLEGKRSELDQLKKENEVINDQLEHVRKESDEEKPNDYEKVNEVIGNISMDTSAIDNEIRLPLEEKPSSAEEPKILEVEECKKNTLTEKS